MKITKGKVLDMYIPEQYKNGALLDIMDRTLIGFKVETEEGIKEVIVEQDEDNTELIIGTEVEIIEQTISGKEFIEIRMIGE